MKVHAYSDEVKCNRKGNRNVSRDWKQVNCIYCINNKLNWIGELNESDEMENHYAHFWILDYVRQYNQEHFSQLTVKTALIRWINGKVNCSGKCEYAVFEKIYGELGKEGGCTPENHAGIGQAVEDIRMGINPEHLS